MSVFIERAHEQIKCLALLLRIFLLSCVEQRDHSLIALDLRSAAFIRHLR